MNKQDLDRARSAPPLRTYPARSRRQEFYNAATHLFGFGLSLAGGVALIPKAWLSGDRWMLVACTQFIVSMAGVYLCSALSHAFSEPGRRDLFRRLDQAFIYGLIVGTYGPFVIRFYPPRLAHATFVVIWIIALIGFASKLLLGHRVNSVSVGLYLALGWGLAMPWFIFPSLLPAHIAAWMFAGGLAYTIGTFFLWNDARYPWFHPVWHLFVILGSAIHFAAILWHIVP